ncbi:RnfABCDGE type electron transport complex subunit B [Fervidobacterium gondwanense]|uniref:Electron transport complex protein RnfB n=1 Tax=Fervidobacterium gondwanense DSM 13020 TaxID=1121883 RepID=A0A1M7S138_FERGO|nr:RnfABCDGE type electron transport complex subunit B [Fervidobacterium gondwanense]SHN52115.1 electron transport complex protein RnfB [Fervidobacterium gondwanense DSM 13020]
MVIYSAVLLGGLGFAFGLFLSYVSEKFKVEEDPTVQLILEALPGINCGACGYPGCEGYAKAIAKGDKYDKCLPGKKNGVEERIKEILANKNANSVHSH